MINSKALKYLKYYQRGKFITLTNEEFVAESFSSPLYLKDGDFFTCSHK